MEGEAYPCKQLEFYETVFSWSTMFFVTIGCFLNQRHGCLFFVKIVSCAQHNIVFSLKKAPTMSSKLIVIFVLVALLATFAACSTKPDGTVLLYFGFSKKFH